MYKKQLSVKFAEQQPRESIKHVSQDIDQIATVIDSHFLLSNSSSEGPQGTYQLMNRKLQSAQFSQDSSSDYTKFINNQNLKPFDEPYGTLPNVVKANHTLKSLHKRLSDIDKHSHNSDENSEAASTYERKFTTTGDAYGIDFRIVKHGRIHKPILPQVQKESKIAAIKSQSYDMSSPKVVKQTRPIKKFPEKARRKHNKDILIAT